MKILLADDDVVTRKMLRQVLEKWGYEVVSCADGSEAWEELQKEDSPKLAILDWMMPKMDGPTLCGEIRKQVGRAYTYMILLTSRDRREDLLKGLEAGADDYVVKPFDRTELRLRLRVGERIVALQEELIEARDAFEKEATRDSLTGVWNRKAVLALLAKEIARAYRNESPLSVVIGDLDLFKSVNDTYGHLTGDIVLRSVAERIKESIRVYDSLGRYGGEEFIIVLPGCDLADAASQAERLRAKICADPIETSDGKVSVSISLGVAQADRDEACDLDSLIRRADRALYRAKERGRNRVEVDQ